jgi:hypothetical protein
MTTGDLLHALVVRWYVTLVGLVLTAFGVLAMHSATPVFETQVDVQFLAPSNFKQVGEKDPANDLVAMAGLVERETKRSGDRLEPASADVPLSGLGVTEGTLVVLPNRDGQFDYSFNQPVLRVKAVGPTAARAAGLRDERVADIVDALTRLQRAQGVPPEERIGTRLIPPVPPVGEVSGGRSRATAVLGLLGLVLTAVAAVAVDRLLVRHRLRRPERGGSGVATSA